jgi:hypothetical protein
VTCGSASGTCRCPFAGGSSGILCATGAIAPAPHAVGSPLSGRGSPPKSSPSMTGILPERSAGAKGFDAARWGRYPATSGQVLWPRRTTVAVKALIAAILLCNPGIGHGAARAYASALDAQAHRHGFDGMTAAALICHESRWVASAVSRDGEDYGLGQIRARYVGACSHDEDPVGSPSAACSSEKARLLDPLNNIRLMAGHIVRWKRTCRAQTGQASERQWLAGYAGVSRPKAREWCGLRRTGRRWTPLHHPKVQEVLEFRRLLASGQPPRRKCR